MSRAHERADRLLAERVRGGDIGATCSYATIAALIGSGIGWAWVHYAAVAFGGSRRSGAPRARGMGAQAGTARPVWRCGLFALGAMSAYHVRRGWELRRNRVSGSVVIALFTLLIATVLRSGTIWSMMTTHALVSLLHWGAGSRWRDADREYRRRPSRPAHRAARGSARPRQRRRSVAARVDLGTLRSSAVG